jgi:protoporphyrinogen oxidase
METLTRALAKAFQGEIRLNTSAPAVDYICTPPQDLPYASAVVVNLGFKMQVTPFKAFGYLVPSSEKEEVLGVIFDSAAFPSLPGPEKLTVMLGGIRHPHMIHKTDSEILNLVFSHLRKHLSLRAFPSSYLIHRHGNAIPQYPIGYKGNGVGVNDAIKRSFDICNFK